VICPSCQFDNIQGLDNCESCGHALAPQDVERPGIDLERTIVRRPLTHVNSPPAVIRVSPDTPLKEVVRQLAEGNVGCVLVVSGTALKGIFSERDLLMKVAHDYEKLQDRPVGDFMTPDPSALKPDDTIAWALNRMDVGDFRHVPIVNGGAVQRVVSVRDIVSYLLEHYPQPTNA